MDEKLSPPLDDLSSTTRVAGFSHMVLLRAVTGVLCIAFLYR
jgi:hypothetical protein